MSLYEGPKRALREQVQALEVLENYPRPPRFVGSAFGALVSLTVPGLGWSTRLAETEDADGLGEAEIDDAIVERHEGKTARVDGRDVSVNMRARKRPDAPNPARTGRQP